MDRRRTLLMIAAGTALAGCAPGRDDGPPQRPAAEPGSARIGADALMTAEGSFAATGPGAGSATGGVRVARDRGEWLIETGPDFVVEGAESPVLMLGDKGPQALLGPLAAGSGRQGFVVPDGLDIGDYLSVWVWCRAAERPVAVARLTLL